MNDDVVMKLDRSDVVDTSGMRMIVFHIDPSKARARGSMPDELARIIGRLIMGQAVQQAELAEWEVHPMRLYSMDELEREGPPRTAGSLKPHLRSIKSDGPHGTLTVLPGPGGGGSKGS